MTAETPVKCRRVPIIPDGGWGWVVVVGSFFIHVFADGFVYSLGVLAHVLLKEFKSDNTVISLIISLLTGITLCAGPIASIICNKYGCRVTAIIGSCIAITGCAVSLLAEAMWHVVISVGMIMGIGFGLMYCPAIVAVTTYFEKRRSLATGIAVSGAGVGTVVFSPVNDFIITNYGWKAIFFTFLVIFVLSIACGWTFRPLPFHESSIAGEISESVANRSNTSENEQNAPPLSNGSDEHDNRIFEETRSLPDDCASEKKAGGSKYRTIGDKVDGYLNKENIFHAYSIRDVPELKDNRDKFTASSRGSTLTLADVETESSNDVKEMSAAQNDILLDTNGASLFTTINNMLSLSLLLDPIFLIYAISNLLTSVGFNSPLYFLPLHATRGLGLDSASASKVLSVYGLCNTIGRVVFGIVADHNLPLPYGLGRDVARNRLWMYNIFLTICGLLTLFSYLCTGFISLCVYAGLFGFSLASYICLTSVILVDLLGLEKLTSAFGLLLLWQGIGTVFGPPVAGYLADISGTYTWTFSFCGFNLLVSGLMLFTIPYFQRQQPLVSHVS